MTNDELFELDEEQFKVQPVESLSKLTKRISGVIMSSPDDMILVCEDNTQFEITKHEHTLLFHYLYTKHIKGESLRGTPIRFVSFIGQLKDTYCHPRFRELVDADIRRHSKECDCNGMCCADCTVTECPIRDCKVIVRHM